MGTSAKESFGQIYISPSDRDVITWKHLIPRYIVQP
jgi:hypothetical protein